MINLNNAFKIALVIAIFIILEQSRTVRDLRTVERSPDDALCQHYHGKNAISTHPINSKRIMGRGYRKDAVKVECGSRISKANNEFLADLNNRGKK